MMKSSVHTEEDDFVPELQRSIHPRERPDWEETLSTMVKHLGYIFPLFSILSTLLLYSIYTPCFSFLNGLHNTLNKAKLLSFLWQFVKEREGAFTTLLPY